MIRKLRERDHAAVMELIGREPEINLFIIGDIEHAGYDRPRVMHWGELDRAGRLSAILTLYYNSLVLYSRAPYDRKGFFKIIQALNFKYFSGETSILDPFSALIPHRRRMDTCLARLKNESEIRNADCGVNCVRAAGLADLAAIVELRNGIQEFEVVPDTSMLHQAFVSKTSRAWVAEDAGQIVAVAQTAAESRAMAMIIGVGTRTGFRRRGFASACMTALCRALLAEGKTLCLFYENPEAGRIYKRLGFEDIGQWSMLIR